MRSKIKIVFFFLALFFYSDILLSQMISSAIMEVRVEVISGSRIDMNSSAFSYSSSANLSEQNRNEQSTGDFQIKYGDFTITVPDGAEIIFEKSEPVKMSGTHSEWMMNSVIKKTELDDSAVSFTFEGDTADQVESGHYTGKQTLTIQYF